MKVTTGEEIVIDESEKKRLEREAERKKMRRRKSSVAEATDTKHGVKVPSANVLKIQDPIENIREADLYNQFYSVYVAKMSSREWREGALKASSSVREPTPSELPRMPGPIECSKKDSDLYSQIQSAMIAKLSAKKWIRGVGWDSTN